MAVTTRTTDPSGIIPMEAYHGHHIGQRSPWKKWIMNQGVPIHTGVSLYDMYTTPVSDWGETGAKAAMLNFETGEMSDAWLIEVPPGGQVKPIHHMFDKMVYVVTGRGATSVWTIGSKKKQTFEWQKGSIFGIPLNAWHEFYNGSGSEPARLICVTSAPLAMNFNPDHNFLFNNTATFPHIYNGEEGYFSSEGKPLEGRLWRSNFNADVRTFPVETMRYRGAGGTNRHFDMGSTHFNAHISEFPSGTYKKGHRHGPGAHLITLEGSGYTLEWNWGKELVEFPWKDGTCYTALNGFWHQHFNTGKKPVRYLAITHGRYHLSLRARPAEQGESAANVAHHGDEMDYEEEEPWIREKYRGECAKNGVTVDDYKMTKEYELSLPTDSWRKEDWT
ncbi:MAG: cupin domain-containing protein [Chloroflexi bacterium]|nr:cupin domain-containing protein [Chloroflexota bacterium]